MLLKYNNKPVEYIALESNRTGRACPTCIFRSGTDCLVIKAKHNTSNQKDHETFSTTLLVCGYGVKGYYRERKFNKKQFKIWK
jgi:hypothetical protein